MLFSWWWFWSWRSLHMLRGPRAGIYRTWFVLFRSSCILFWSTDWAGQFLLSILSSISSLRVSTEPIAGATPRHYTALLCPTLSYHTPGLFYMVRPGVQPNWVEQHWPGGCRVAERRGLRGLARNTTDTRELCQTHNWSNIINHGPNKEIKL